MYSFDVFDTLIIRTTATPQGIFALMKEQIYKEQSINKLDEYVADNFFELRIHSEELARRAGNYQDREEVTLYDIYKAMAVCGCLEEEQIRYLCQLEAETEIANVSGIERNIYYLKRLLNRGEQVVLISDMYLPADTIKKMLLAVDEVFRGIPVYVSSEYGKRKTTGNLYRTVKELEQVDFEEWTHVGDNLFQDMEVPYQLGIRVEFSPVTELSEFEKKILRDHGEDSRLQLMVKTALRSICQSESEGKAETARCMGGRYAGPILYSYAEWIVEQAERKGIKRLYFIARDGYLVKQIADIILKDRKTGITTKYIYGSRKAWRMQSLSEDHYNLYQLVLWSHTYRLQTLQELADFLRVPLQGLYEYLPGVYAKDKSNTNITNQELEFIVGKLSEDLAFRKYHLGRLLEEKRLVQEYLAQEVDVRDDAFAFVDVAGGGLTQGCLWELLKDRYSKPIYTFYFKVDRVGLIENSITYTFMPSFLEHDLAIEMICKAPHGQTKGYIRRDGEIVPEIEEGEQELLLEHGFLEYEQGILDFAKLMRQVSEVHNMKIGSMRNILLYLQHIGRTPSKEMLEFFSSMPNNETGRNTEIVEYAPRLTEQEIKEIFLGRTNEPTGVVYKGTDLSYSVLRASEEERQLIEWCKKEHDTITGKLYRQEKEREQNELRKCYGRAAFYPVRLLEEKVILYGAGKFGQDLYRRLEKDMEHEVVLWVDKDADECQKRGLLEVRNVSEITCTGSEQIVVAVVSEDMAAEITEELRNMGIPTRRVLWVKPYYVPNVVVKWKTENIG